MREPGNQAPEPAQTQPRQAPAGVQRALEQPLAATKPALSAIVISQNDRGRIANSSQIARNFMPERPNQFNEGFGSDIAFSAGCKRATSDTSGRTIKAAVA